MIKLQSIQTYLTSLKLKDGTPLYSTGRYIRILGFIINIQSLFKLVPDVLVNQTFLLTYKFSQDHLELFFSAVCRSGGWNNNPTCKQLISTFRHLVVHSGVSPSSNGNVFVVDGTQLIRACSTTADKQIQSSPFVEPAIDHMYCNWVQPKYTAFVENIVVYIAGFVVKKAMPQVCCNVCRESLVFKASRPPRENMYHLLQLKDNGGLVIPGTVDILLYAEKAIRMLMNIASACSVCSKQRVVSFVKNQCGELDPLCLGVHIIESQSGIDNHFFDLLELLINIYYNIRQRHVARLHTSNLKSCSVRQKLTKLILFQGH